jgi:hypothetical protein
MFIFKGKYLFLIYILLLSVVQLSFAGNKNYRARGVPVDRYEGIKSSPVSGVDIELLSALINYRDKQKTVPPYYKLKFYLPKSTKLKFVVRELSPYYFYWLDKVKDNYWWKRGFNNYKWPTKELIKPLRLKLPKLGVVIRLAGKSKEEQIVPAAFYHSVSPKQVAIEGYLFYFRVRYKAKLKYLIYKGTDNIPLVKGKKRKRRRDKPFSIVWNSTQAKEGMYKLVISGIFLKNNKPIHKVVKFYHKPNF